MAADGLLLNPHYRRLSLDFADITPNSADAEQTSLLPRRASTISVAEWDEQHVSGPSTTLPHRDEGMGKSIELGDVGSTMAVVDGVSRQCEYFQPELSAADAARCLRQGSVGSFLVHGVDETTDDEEEREARFGLSFKDEDGSIIHKVSMAMLQRQSHRS
jgi:hypothetical protein